MGWLAGIGVEAAKGVVWHDHLELRSESLVLFHCCGRANAQKQAARAIDVHPVNSQQSMILHEEHTMFVRLPLVICYTARSALFCRLNN